MSDLDLRARYNRGLERIAALEAEVGRLNRSLMAIEEAEASVCPEDVGFVEYIKALTKAKEQAEAALAELTVKPNEDLALVHQWWELARALSEKIPVLKFVISWVYESRRSTDIIEAQLRDETKRLEAALAELKKRIEDDPHFIEACESAAGLCVSESERMKYHEKTRRHWEVVATVLRAHGIGVKLLQEESANLRTALREAEDEKGRLREALDDIASGELGINLCIKRAKAALTPEVKK